MSKISIEKQLRMMESLRKFFRVFGYLITIFVVVMAGGFHCGVKLSGSEKRSIQIREYNASSEEVIEVLKTVLEDEGYQIKTVSSDLLRAEKLQDKSLGKKILTKGDQETIQVESKVSSKETNRSRIRMRIRRLEEGKPTVEIEKEKEYDYLFNQISELLSQ